MNYKNTLRSLAIIAGTVMPASYASAVNTGVGIGVDIYTGGTWGDHQDPYNRGYSRGKQENLRELHGLQEKLNNSEEELRALNDDRTILFLCCVTSVAT